VQARPEWKHERPIVPPQPVGRAGKHRPSPGVDHTVAAGGTDLVVEEELDVLRSGGEHGAVGRLRAD
jgi:hypothetical protein